MRFTAASVSSPKATRLAHTACQERPPFVLSLRRYASHGTYGPQAVGSPGLAAGSFASSSLPWDLYAANHTSIFPFKENAGRL